MDLEEISKILFKAFSNHYQIRLQLKNRNYNNEFRKDITGFVDGYHNSQIIISGYAVEIEDINHVAEALHKAFHPQKVNYGAYGDTGHHLHFHLVPKYTDGYEWGGTFAMNPGEKFLSDEEYAALIDEIKKYL